MLNLNDNTLKRIIITITLLTAGITSYAGGGWVYGKHKGYFKLAQNMIRSPYFYNPGGTITDIPTVSLYTTSLYGEYGITDRLNAIVYIPFFVRSTLNRVHFNQSGDEIPGDQLNAFGDTNVGFKYGFFQNKAIVMSLGVTFGLPLGHWRVNSEHILQTGDGEFNQMITLQASHSFYPKPFYVSAMVGFNNRTRGFSEEFRYAAEAGLTLKKWICDLKIYSINSLYNGTAGENQANSIFANNTEYFSFTPEVNYLFNEKTGISGSVGFALAGRNILASPNFSLGVFMTF